MLLKENSQRKVSLNAKSDTTVNKLELLFLAAYGLYILSMALENTSLRLKMDMLLQLMRYVSYGLCVVKIVMQRGYGKNRFLFYAVTLCFALGESFICGRREIFFLLLFMMAFYEVDLKRTLFLQAVIQFACILFVWLFCYLGYFENIQVYFHNTMRYSMGFDYVGFGATLFFLTECCWLYFREKKITIAEVMGIMGLWLLIYHFTDSRTQFGLGIILVIFCYLSKFLNINMKKKWIKLCALASPVFLTVIVWIFQLYYNMNNRTQAMIRLNQTLSGRLALIQQAMNNYGFHILGAKIEWISNMNNAVRNRYTYVDCTYFKILFDFGIIIGILFLAVYICQMYYMWEKESFIGCMIVLCICGFAYMYAVKELSTNPFLLLGGGLFFGKSKIHKT